MSTLVIIRHAKAVTRPGVADVDRPLSPRGMADAKAAGIWLRERLPRLGQVVSSPAVRAARTAERLLAAYGGDPAPAYRSEMYEASLRDLERLLSGLDTERDPVVLVGHNPSVSDLVRALTGTPATLATCGIAILSLPAPAAGRPSRAHDAGSAMLQELTAVRAASRPPGY